MGVLLGGVMLDGLAAVAGIRFGGAQALVVHRLPGGARVIDAMGPDDADIAWQGYLAGSDALDQARLLDAMRAAGSALPLSWDAALYTVVISQLDFTYSNSWWISYRIRCAVLTAPAFEQDAAAAGVVNLIVGDLTTASSWFDVAPALATVQSSSATAVGTPAYAASSLAMAGVGAQIDAGISAADTAMSAGDVTDMVVAAGVLAQLTAARGYVGRAAMNLANAGT
jgi:hypothetical protein